jgi:hypothetical protein
MLVQPKKKSPWLKRILAGSITLLVIGGGIYWYISTEKFADTRNRKAAYTVNSTEFIDEFETDITAANAKYTDKIITVNGIVSAIEPADTTINLKFIDTASGSYAIFAFQEQHANEARSVKEGDMVSIKGSCSGGIFSRLRKTTFISFKRCALNKK